MRNTGPCLSRQARGRRDRRSTAVCAPWWGAAIRRGEPVSNLRSMRFASTLLVSQALCVRKRPDYVAADHHLWFDVPGLHRPLVARTTKWRNGFSARPAAVERAQRTHHTVAVKLLDRGSGTATPNAGRAQDRVPRTRWEFATPCPTLPRLPIGADAVTVLESVSAAPAVMPQRRKDAKAHDKQTELLRPEERLFHRRASAGSEGGRTYRERPFAATYEVPSGSPRANAEEP